MPTRRVFLGSFAATATATACFSGEQAATAAAGPLADPEDDTPLDAITPNENFYRVAISAYTPDAATLEAWTLTLATEDGDEVVLTLADLVEIGGEEQERTLSCIGGSTVNTVGNAMWTAIRMDDLLEAVELSPASRLQWVRITAGDGYATSIPRSDIAAGLALAYLMNGVPLPAEHGAPLRALVPGRYGMKNPKWIVRIDFVEDFEAGFWESRGWSQDAGYQICSWFKSPGYGSTVGADGAWLKGVAFAGEAGISKVEVTDDGLAWIEAEITYPGGPGVWTLWQLRWVPPTAGSYTLSVRATTADGRVQTAVEVYDADLDGLEAFDSLGLVAT